MASSDGYEPLPQREGDETYPPPSLASRDSKEEREQQPALPLPIGSRRQQVLVVLSALVALLVGGSVGAVLARTDGSGSFWLSRSSLLLRCGMSSNHVLCGDAYNQPGCKSLHLMCKLALLTFSGTTDAQTSGADSRKQRFGTSWATVEDCKRARQAREADSRTRLRQLGTVLADARWKPG